MPRRCWLCSRIEASTIITIGTLFLPLGLNVAIFALLFRYIPQMDVRFDAIWPAAVLGGIGSIPGAAVGGLFLGLVESFATGYVSSDYEDVFAFVLLVLVLIFRPAGILGRATTQKV